MVAEEKDLLEERPQLRLIVVAVDGSSCALGACRLAATIAACSGAAIHAVHVAVPSLPGLTISPREARDSEYAARALGERVIADARAAVGDLVPFSGEVVFGLPADVIRERADGLGADLVVVGSRGLGTIDRLLLGSVSGTVAARCSRSVLVYRESAERR